MLALGGWSVDIVSACDDKFVPCFSAMLHSAALFNPEATFWLLANRISEANRNSLAAFARSLGIRLNIVPVADSELAGLQETERLPLPTYARLLIPSILPGTIDRALYLDGDTTVTGSLAPLFSLDMQGKPAAAAADGPRITEIEIPLLRLPPDAVYCNTGVLLLDLAAWRRESIAEQILDFSRRAPKLRLQDQSALNKVLATRLLILPSSWNFLNYVDWQAVKPPSIIHYAGLQKPWNDVTSPFVDLYRFHQDQTPFAYDLPVLDPRQHQRRMIGSYFGIRRYRRYAREWAFSRLVRREITEPALAMARNLVAIRNGEPA